MITIGDTTMFTKCDKEGCKCEECRCEECDCT